jgi:Raf kinase inhibitor-like YbhB/YbcL family protein
MALLRNPRDRVDRRSRGGVALAVFALLSLAVSGVVGCGPKGAAPGSGATGDNPKGDANMAITITSTAFKAGVAIPKQYTGEGDDHSPALAWSGVPGGAKELAMICDDPDAPTKEPWVHWVIYKIPADTKSLSEGIPRKPRPPAPAGALQGVNTFESDNIGYRGPMPPPGHGVHHYHFKLYALDKPLELETGLDKKALLAAMGGHIVAQGELVGTYQR